MNSKKNQYIKYTRGELENYTQHDESCVQRVNCVEPIRFSPTIIADFQASIGRILGRKIGKFDTKLNGIVLDFRNTKVLNSQSSVRQDSPFSVVNVETNFYVFSPKKGAIVTGLVKLIHRMSMETVVSVVIYRVFNVKVTVRGKVKQELEKNQEIQIRVMDFHFDNVIPFIEGEIVDSGILMKPKRLFDDTHDSGISESSVSSEAVKGNSRGSQEIKVKQERESSVESFNVTQRPKSRKQKSSVETESKVSMRIKAEPATTDDEDSEVSAANDKKSLKGEEVCKVEQRTKTSQEKKSRKRKRVVDDDDFETSLQNIISAAQVKNEK